MKDGVWKKAYNRMERKRNDKNVVGGEMDVERWKEGSRKKYK